MMAINVGAVVAGVSREDVREKYDAWKAGQPPTNWGFVTEEMVDAALDTWHKTSSSEWRRYYRSREDMRAGMRAVLEGALASAEKLSCPYSSTKPT